MAKLVASRYAEALFELALENDKLKLFDEEVKLVLDTLKEDKDFLTFLKHPRISAQEKQNVFDSALKGKISDEIISLFSVVLRKNREAEFIKILMIFNEMVEKHLGIVTAVVASAKPLSEEQLSAIKNKLSQNLDKQVNIKAEVDESLIGGVRISVAGHVIDGTVKKHLNDLKNQLLNIQLV